MCEWKFLSKFALQKMDFLHQMNDTDIFQTMRDILVAESKAVASIPVTEAYPRAIELIMHHVHKLGGKIVASGMGKAGQIATNIATTLASTGTPSVSLHPSDAQHGDLGVIQPNDLLLLVSNSGKTREMLELVELARGMWPEIPIIVITSNTSSPLAAKANVVLATGGAPEVCPLGLTPTTSTTLMSVIGDVLVVNIMKIIGFTTEDYAKRHHGGYLGIVSRGEK